jgi:hypothetical protein
MVAFGCGGSSSGGADADPSGALDATSGAPDAAGSGGQGGEVFPASLLLFGGDSGDALLGDTWSWDGEGWAGLVVPNQPEPRRDHALAYDAARERVVVFGGWDGGSYFGDTWTWNGAGWTRVADSAEPEERGRHALTYDAARAVVVLFGGSRTDGIAGEIFFDDTWLWNGQAWARDTAGEAALPRAGHAMAFDEAGGEVVLFGGANEQLLSDTWVRGEAGWREVSLPAESPPARRDHALAYDPNRERVVLFGGEGAESLLDDTWEWDGASWDLVEVSGDAPAARAGHAMAYDPALERVILFGGITADGEPLGETLAWDGSAWTILPGDDARGPARSAHTISEGPQP